MKKKTNTPSPFHELPTKEPWVEWEKGTFDVTIELDKFDGNIILSITHNGNSWTSVRFLDRDQLKKLTEKCQKFLDNNTLI